MGAFTSRRNAGVEELDITMTNAYRYPPRSGCYFGSHFIMGGERFETVQPEMYLFGENQDLNYLGSRPVPFPYPAPQAHEPTKTLKSLVNIRKDSIRFVRAPSSDGTKPAEVVIDGVDEGGDGAGKQKTDTMGSQDSRKGKKAVEPPAPPPATQYNIEFTFDTDVRCAITVYYFATEEISNGQAVYHPSDPTMNSETFHYKRGANQVFCQLSHVIDPSKFPAEDWQYSPDKDNVPVVIQCVVDEEENGSHSHMTFCVVEKVSDAVYMLKPLKQKQMVDGLCYLLQEIYGIENKYAQWSKDDDIEDTGCECVICMCEVRDTLILPCRHLCLCNSCADNLRYQASNCPICRVPFRALLQIRAMRKKLPNAPPTPQLIDSSDETPLSQEGVPPGYEAVSLIEALNGTSHMAPPAGRQDMPPDGENTRLDLILSNVDESPTTSPSQSPSMTLKSKSKIQSSMRSNHSRRSVREVAVMPEPATGGVVPGDSTRGAKTNLHYETEQLTQQVLMVSDLHDPKVAIATVAVMSETVKEEEASKKKKGQSASRRSKAEPAVKDPLTVPDSTAIVVSEVDDDDDDCANDADDDTADDTDGDARIAVGGEDQGADTEDQEGKEQADGDSSDDDGSGFKVPVGPMFVKTKSPPSPLHLGELDSTLLEPLTLPGTPLSTSADGSGDSYSSTSSNRILLPRGQHSPNTANSSDDNESKSVV